MWGILVSAGYALLTWVVRSVLVKFVLYFGLFFFVSEAMPIVSGWLPQGDGGLASSLSNLSPGAWYFLDLVMLPSYGLPAILAAAVTRFIIRRLPVIG